MQAEMIHIGDKIDICALEQVDIAQKTGENPKVLVSQVLDLKEDGSIEIAMPLEGTKLVLLPLDLRYQFTFYTSGGMYKANGQIEERYKKDNFFMLRVSLHTRLEKFQRREFFRLETGLDITYQFIDEATAKLPDMQSIFRTVRNVDFYKHLIKGHTLDISGGGVRFLSRDEMPEDDKNHTRQYLLISILLEMDDSEEMIDLVAKVIECKRQVRDNGVFYEYRAEFLAKDKKTCDAIVRFVFAKERKSRKK